MKNFTKLFTMFALAIVVVGQGTVPQNARTPLQGQLLARRAAIVDIYSQLGGVQGLNIVKEDFDGKVYTVKVVK